MRVALVCTVVMTMSNAFAPIGRRSQISKYETICHVETMTVNNDFGTAIPSPTEADPYTQFGLSGPEDLALGVDINDLIKWVGTKDDLVNRVQTDISLTSRIEAEDQVNALLMDAEVLQRLLFYEKNKDEIAQRNEASGSENQLGTIGTYAVWLGIGATLPALKRTYLDPKFESGEWSKIHISDYLPFLPKLNNAATDVIDITTSSSSSVSMVTDLTRTTTEALLDAIPSDTVVAAVSGSASDILSNTL